IKLKLWQKLTIVAALVSIIVVVLIYINLPDGTVVLTKNLPDTNRQEIESELNKLGVDYEVGENNTITVPKEKATWVRNDLINLGLLSSEEDPDNILLNSSLGESSQDKDNKKLI